MKRSYLRVVALGPVVPGASLAEDKVVRAKQLAWKAKLSGRNNNAFDIFVFSLSEQRYCCKHAKNKKTFDNSESPCTHAEERAEGARAHGIHRARLEVHQDGARHVAAASRLFPPFHSFRASNLVTNHNVSPLLSKTNGSIDDAR